MRRVRPDPEEDSGVMVQGREGQRGTQSAVSAAPVSETEDGGSVPTLVTSLQEHSETGGVNAANQFKCSKNTGCDTFKWGSRIILLHRCKILSAERS